MRTACGAESWGDAECESATVTKTRAKSLSLYHMQKIIGSR